MKNKFITRLEPHTLKARSSPHCHLHGHQPLCIKQQSQSAALKLISVTGQATKEESPSPYVYMWVVTPRLQPGQVGATRQVDQNLEPPQQISVPPQQTSWPPQPASSAYICTKLRSIGANTVAPTPAPPLPPHTPAAVLPLLLLLRTPLRLCGRASSGLVGLPMSDTLQGRPQGSA